MFIRYQACPFGACLRTRNGLPTHARQDELVDYLVLGLVLGLRVNQVRPQEGSWLRLSLKLRWNIYRGQLFRSDQSGQWANLRMDSRKSPKFSGAGVWRVLYDRSTLVQSSRLGLQHFAMV
jgi:hypothetical protein